MIFTYDGIWGFSLKFLGNIKKGLRVGPLGLWIFGKRFIAYFLPKCTWTSDFKKNVNWSKTWLTYHVLICSILYFHPYSHEQSPRQSGPSGRRPFRMPFSGSFVSNPNSRSVRVNLRPSPRPPSPNSNVSDNGVLIRWLNFDACVSQSDKYKYTCILWCGIQMKILTVYHTVHGSTVQCITRWQNKINFPT